MAEDAGDHFDPNKYWPGPMDAKDLAELAHSDKTLIVKASAMGNLLYTINRLMACQVHFMNAAILADNGDIEEARKLQRVAQFNFMLAADTAEIVPGSLFNPVWEPEDSKK